MDGQINCFHRQSQECPTSIFSYVNSLHNLYILGRTCEGIRILILGLQPRDKATVLGVNTIVFFLEVPRGEKRFCS